MQRKSDRICSVLTVICGTLTALLYLIYFICGLYFGTDAVSLMISIAAIGLSCAAIFLRHKLPRFLTRLFCIGLCFYMLTFIAFCTLIAVDQATPAPAADVPSVVLVFGCRTYGMTPGRQLAARLNKALVLLQNNPDAVCIVSGGQGPNETVSEAEAMRGYLVAHGISPDRIFTEDQSASTILNIRYSKEIIDANSLTDRQIIAVSSFYHLPRIKLLGDWYGVSFSGFASAFNDNPFTLVADLVREYMAYAKLIFVH